MDVLTLDDVAGQATEVRWELVTPGLAVIGTVDVSADAAVAVENNANRPVKRQLSGMVLPPSVARDVNPFRDRLRPVWLVADPVSESVLEFPLGVFTFASLARREARYSAADGSEGDATMGDLLIAFDQPLDRSVAYPAGTPIYDAMVEQAVAAGVLVHEIQNTGKRLGSPLSWVVGRDSRLRVVNDLAALAGFYSPWFDNRGVFVGRTVPELGQAPADFDYDTNPRIYDGTIVQTDDALAAPNRYLVVDTAATEQPISAFYDVPSTAPHSIANRGFPVVKLIEMQGLASTTAALEAARAAALTDTATFAWAEVQTVPEPRMDTWNVVQFGDLLAGPSSGELWRVQSWRLTLAPGGPMAQSWRRLYR